MNLKYKKTSRRNFASLPAMCELDIILISNLWERFDREVRDCPSREDKINWYSIRMKTILFSWNRKHIIIPLGFDVVLAPVQVQGKLYIPGWDGSTCGVVPPLHLVAGPSNTPHQAPTQSWHWLVAAVDWVISSWEHHSAQCHSSNKTVYSTVHTWQDSQQVNKISSF